MTEARQIFLHITGRKYHNNFEGRLHFIVHAVQIGRVLKSVFTR